MNHFKRFRNVSLYNVVFIFFLIFFLHCRVNPNPKGSLLDPLSQEGIIPSLLLNDFINNVSIRNWTTFVSSPFGTTDPTDSVVFDQISPTIYAIYIRNSNLQTGLYSITGGTTYSQLGVLINNTNTNIFGAFTGRFQLSNYNSLDNGLNWNSSVTIPGFCMVKYSGTSAYILGDGFVNRTTDSGVSTNTLTSSPAYPSRTSGSCLFANGKAYLLGGKNGSGYLFDFWESTDGINWALITERVKQTSGGGINRPCNNIQNSNDISVLGLVYSTVTTYKFYVIFNNLSLLQSNDGKTWTCSNPNINFYSGFNSIANRAVLIGKRLYVYGQPENAYTDLE
ncbi:hypothetical protein EHQ47_16505 [Leptospira bourretii]|uniref:hypothetical protein n=1 Tax=Leptospira bourretii TaxID=2484962 RepID=UPI001090BDC6|nr:hypothetical protein [Leptospira bourretii]TGL19700.1 hypothetical protein EHQ47_16505 [Leptospira bourretii]